MGTVMLVENVFYELAIRHMIRKPNIQMIHKMQPLMGVGG